MKKINYSAITLKHEYLPGSNNKTLVIYLCRKILGVGEIRNLWYVVLLLYNFINYYLKQKLDK